MEAININTERTLTRKTLATDDETAEQFVAVMFSKFVSAMFEGKETKSEMGGGGFGEEMFQGVYSEILANTLVKSGLAEDLKQNIKQSLESYKEVQNVVATAA